MKANKIQQCLCDVIHSQQDFWRNSNDISSPTHITDIEDECFAQLDGILKDKEVEEFGNRLKDLYWFIRRFDKL